MMLQNVDPDLQPISQLWRHTLNPRTSKMHAERVSARAMEYPSVNPGFSGALSSAANFKPRLMALASIWFVVMPAPSALFWIRSWTNNIRLMGLMTNHVCLLPRQELL